MSSLKVYNAKLKGRRYLADIFERIVRRYRIPATSNSEFRAAVQLIQPLDFLVVTGHAEFIRIAPMIHESHPELLADS